MEQNTSQLHLQVPRPPNPSADKGVIPRISTLDEESPTLSADAEWDPSILGPVAAMKMLCRAVVALANVTGDVPPTPPISRPSTPRAAHRAESAGPQMRNSSRPATPVPSDDLKGPRFRGFDMGSPEAHQHEPAAPHAGLDAGPARVQQVAIARKFYSKKPPPISLLDYLMRLQRYCPMSTAVYLAAASYIHKLAVEDKLVLVTARTVHRLLLGTLCVAMKALEDLRYPQARFAGVGGVRESELQKLEISVCYLLEFELQVSLESLRRNTLWLQQVGMQAALFNSPKVPTLAMPPMTRAVRTEVAV